MQSHRGTKNYYDVLGLKTDASQADIDKAYKKLSNEWHPEKCKTNRKEAELKFQQINEAYDVLSNHNRRSHYDEVAHRQYTDQDADQTFDRFYQQYGTQDQNEKKFFDKHYPERKRNYYQVLGVPRNASQSDIQSAYRKLALQYHPKNNEGNAQARKRFNEINEAYNAISSDARRNNYDTFSFGQIAPLRAHNIFENFWGDRFNQLDEVDEYFRPMLRTKWSRNLDKALKGFDDEKITDGESMKTSTYYTNINGVQQKKSITSKTKYQNGVPVTETTQEYEFPDGNREVRKIKDDGKGNVTSNVYNLKKGEALPITN